MWRFSAALLAALALCINDQAGAFTAPFSKVASKALTSPLNVSVEKEATTAPVSSSSSSDEERPFFSNIMAANRAEIAVRIMRAATEMNAGTVGIYVNEDRYSQHRWGADRSFLLEKEDDATPISAYLDINQIINIAKDANVDAIHPGYGKANIVSIVNQWCCVVTNSRGIV
jgi:pyruvate carboxylase